MYSSTLDLRRSAPKRVRSENQPPTGRDNDDLILLLIFSDNTQCTPFANQRNGHLYLGAYANLRKPVQGYFHGKICSEDSGGDSDSRGGYLVANRKCVVSQLGSKCEYGGCKDQRSQASTTTGMADGIASRFLAFGWLLGLPERLSRTNISVHVRPRGAPPLSRSARD